MKKIQVFAQVFLILGVYFDSKRAKKMSAFGGQWSKSLKYAALMYSLLLFNVNFGLKREMLNDSLLKAKILK